MNKPKKKNHKLKTKPSVLSARHLAITILYECQKSHHTLDYWLERSAAPIEALNRPDRALLHALVYGVLRWQGRLDWIIAQLVDRPDKKIDALVRIVMRVGIFQMIYLDRIPPSAAVNTAVEWVKINNRSWAAGFVNSVLRKAASQSDSISWPDQEKSPVQAIAVQHAFPPWLIKRWIAQHGMEKTILHCQALNTIAPLTLRTNTLNTTRSDIMAALSSLASNIVPTRHAPEGVHFASPAKPVSQWPLFRQGALQIQGEAAQLIAHLLSAAPGHRIWDACAGLGTKTAHIAQIMENNGYILATDHSQEKLALLEKEMQRLAISVVATHCMDLAKATPPETGFDRILLDAPCSGLGVLQNNPDGKWRIQPKDFKIYGRRQLAFLEQVQPHLVPGGLLVYAVCSTEPEENERVIDQFLQKHPEFVIQTPELDNIVDLDNLLNDKGYLKTAPHRHQMDGFFAAVLKKAT